MNTGFESSVQKWDIQFLSEIIKKQYFNLTFMQLVANCANSKGYKRTEKWLKPWHMGTHLRELRELSNEYQHDSV